MSVKAQFTGGPRNGKTNTLRNLDQAPDRITVKPAELKAHNFKSGYYQRNKQEAGLHPEGVLASYIWRTN